MANEKQVAKRKAIIEQADKLAQKAGSANAQEHIQKLGRSMQSEDVVESREASRAAGDFTANLALLVLYQDIDGDYSMEGYDWINHFEVKKIEAGNSWQFQRTKPTGVDAYVENAFIPTKLSLPKEDVHTLHFYKTNTTSSAQPVLSDYAYKILKPLTILRDQWVPYFMSGKLQEFIDKITQMVYTSVYMRNYAEVCKLIKKLKTGYSSNNTNGGLKKVFDESGYTGTVNISSQVTNILDVFTKVIFPQINEMKFYNSEFNANLPGETSNSINRSTKDDILIFMNHKTYTKLTNGVLANVFNNKLLEVETFINPKNIIPVGKEFTVGDSDTEVTMGQDLIWENEILVINKNIIKGMSFVDTKESQAWTQNMSLQISYHKWMAYGIIPWGQGFVVRTNKLTVMPNV